MQINENLKKIRTNKGMTQEQLAEITGITKEQISRIERGGEKSNPTARTVYKLMKALNCSANSLMEDQKLMSKESMLKTVIEKAEQLPEEDKETIIKITKALIRSHTIEKINR